MIAVQPSTEKLFQSACSNQDIDLISLDMSSRLPFYIKGPPVALAMSKGIFFEITYSRGIHGKYIQ